MGIIHLLFKQTKLFVLLLVASSVSSTLETWFNCSQPSCQSFFANSSCQPSGCFCGDSTSQSTCNVPPANITANTGASLVTNQGPLSCCRCDSNSTFCCKKCPTSTAAAPTTVTVTQTPQDVAYLEVALSTDCNSYVAQKTQVTSSFKQSMISVITNTVIDVINITCSNGLEPFCGVGVSGMNTQGQAMGYVKCDVMLIMATIKSTPFKLRTQVAKLQKWVQAGNLTVKFWNGALMKVPFLISRYSNTSRVLYKGPLKLSTTQTPPKTVSPIITNLWPLIYSGIGVGCFIFLCILYQCLKQSYYLRKRKFTNINSNRINSRKKKVDEAMENKQPTINEPQNQEQAAGFDMTHHRLPTVDNEMLSRRYDWTTPSYIPSMLAPAYSESNHINSPPRLMLDDEESDGEKRSIGKSSVVNVDEESDEDLREILESDDEDHRPSTRQSYLSTRKSLPIPNHRKYSTTSKTSQEKKNGSASITSRSQNRHTSQGNRNGSAVSSTKIVANDRKYSTSDAIRGNSASITKMAIPSNNNTARKSSYSSPSSGNRSPRPSFGNIKANRITPIENPRKLLVSSLKPKKTLDSVC